MNIGRVWIVLGLAACGGTSEMSGVSGTLATDTVFAEGDTVWVRGYGLRNAHVTLGGVPVMPVSPGPTKLGVVLDRGLPPCDGDIHETILVIRADDGVVDLRVRTRGAAPEAQLEVGQHVVVGESASLACGVSLTSGATFGVAVIQPVEPVDDNFGLDHQSRHGVNLSIRPVYSAAGARAPLSIRREPLVHASRAKTLLRRPFAVTSGCTSLGGVGDSVLLRHDRRLDAFAMAPQSRYYLVAASGRLGVLARAEDRELWSADGQVLAQRVVDSLSSAAMPFLERTFVPFPDTDDDPRLFVALAPMHGFAGIAGAADVRADGCPMDLVWLSPQASTLSEAGLASAAAVFVHETAHLADAAAGVFATKPPWSIEGYAALAAQVWFEERNHIGFWDQDFAGAYCGRGCSLSLLQDGRLGYPGLDLGAAVNGASILRYLIQQAVDSGQSPLGAVNALRWRTGVWRVLPSFEAIGGSGRTEAELLGEFLLQFYADDLPASSRIKHQTFALASGAFDIPGVWSFPLRTQVVEGAVPRDVLLDLAKPDGVILELRTAAERVVLRTLGASHVALAIVRRR